MNGIDDFDTSTEKNVIEVELENCDVHIPLASNSSPGIASFDSKDFTVEAGTGCVKSKMKYGTPQYLGFVKENVDYNGSNALSWLLNSNSVKPVNKAEVGDIIMLTEVYDKFTPGSLFKIIAVTNVVLTGLEVLGVLACNFDNYIVQETGNSEDKVMSQKAATENFAHLIGGKVPASQLPSYVDDVLEYNTKSDFPKTGEEGKIYVDKETNSTYRWSGTTYIKISSGDLNFENGTGENSVQQKGTTASYDNMATFGRFNKNSPDNIFEIGCGTDTTNKSNAFEVLKDGRAKVKSAPIDNDDVVRKQELDTKFDKTNIVQTTGNSTTEVMSQKAVTDELNKLQNLERIKIGGKDANPIKITCDDTGYTINFPKDMWFIYSNTYYNSTEDITVTRAYMTTMVFCLFKKSTKEFRIINYTELNTLNLSDDCYVCSIRSNGKNSPYAFVDLSVPYLYNGYWFGQRYVSSKIIGGTDYIKVDTSTKTITIPKDTLIVFDDRSHSIISSDAIIDYTTIASSAKYILFNRKTNIFSVMPYSGPWGFDANTSVIGTIRTSNGSYPIVMDIGVPYVVDGKLFGSENIRADDLWQINNKNIKAINHRGYCNVAPENTLPAYKLSRKNGFDYVECDVSFTSDNVPVLLHDDTIDRTSNGTGSINSMTFEEARTYDFGSWKSSAYAGTTIPSFEEFISLCKKLGLHPYIELKSAGLSQENVNKCVEIVKKYGMLRNVTWISFLSSALDYVLTADGKARICIVTGEVTESAITYAIGKLTNNIDIVIDAQASTLTAEMVQSCIDNNLPLGVWTVENTNILTNFPYISEVTTNGMNLTKTLFNENL